MIPLKSDNPSASRLHRLVSPSHTFTSLATVIDDVHELFDDWQQNGRFSRFLDEQSLHWARLAVHEWIANLVQHADFGDAEPMITMACWERDRKLVCVIEDNSAGFNFNEELSSRRSAEYGAPPPERGMGLLMLAACTTNVRYRRQEGRLNQIQFYVSADQDPCLNIRF